MLLSWFNARDAQAFGVQLARTVIETVPPDAKLKEAAFRKKASRTLEKLSNQIAAFKAEYPLNTYKKAKLGNAFKWALRDAGYDPLYADEFTNWLLLRC